MPEDVFDRLMSQIHQRAKELPTGSYTTKLITGGVPAMGAKVTEEAAEVVQAAATLAQLQSSSASANSSSSPTPEQLQAARAHLIYEAGDVLYHMWVLLGSFGIHTDDLRAELQRREGTSGLEEKRRRKEST